MIVKTIHFSRGPVGGPSCPALDARRQPPAQCSRPALRASAFALGPPSGQFAFVSRLMMRGGCEAVREHTLIVMSFVIITLGSARV